MGKYVAIEDNDTIRNEAIAAQTLPIAWDRDENDRHGRFNCNGVVATRRGVRGMKRREAFYPVAYCTECGQAFDW